MKVTLKMFSIYLGVSTKTAKKTYQFYLNSINNECTCIHRKFLLYSDISKLDGVSIDHVINACK